MSVGVRDHWESVGAGYHAEWEPPAKRALSRRELDFVGDGLAASPARTALDVGIGNGRILAELLRRDPRTVVHGVDIAAAMVEACRRRFDGEERVRGLHVCDLSREPVPVEGELDFVSAIRMLKYNDAWREMVAKLAERLSRGGVIVFSMPGRDSLNRLSRDYAVPWHSASPGDLAGLCRELGLGVLALRGFTKLPHFAYNRPRSPAVARGVVALDRALERAIGGTALARELFVAARRS